MESPERRSIEQLKEEEILTAQPEVFLGLVVRGESPTWGDHTLWGKIKSFAGTLFGFLTRLPLVQPLSPVVGLLSQVGQKFHLAPPTRLWAVVVDPYGRIVPPREGTPGDSPRMEQAIPVVLPYGAHFPQPQPGDIICVLRVGGVFVAVPGILGGGMAQVEGGRADALPRPPPR